MIFRLVPLGVTFVNWHFDQVRLCLYWISESLIPAYAAAEYVIVASHVFVGEARQGVMNSMVGGSGYDSILSLY